jgi:hypothetical protein
VEAENRAGREKSAGDNGKRDGGVLGGFWVLRPPKLQ